MWGSAPYDRWPDGVVLVMQNVCQSILMTVCVLGFAIEFYVAIRSNVRRGRSPTSTTLEFRGMAVGQALFYVGAFGALIVGIVGGRVGD